MSGPRFISPTIVFRMSGRPVCSGGKAAFGGIRTEPLLNNKIKKKQTCKEHNIRTANSSKQYANILRLSAKTAMLENGWVLSDEPVYLIITFYLNYPYKMAADDIKAIYKADLPPTRAPKLHVQATHFAKWLEGVVYEKAIQITGMLLLKRYTDGDEHVDFLIGRPRNFKELVYDIRNN